MKRLVFICGMVMLLCTAGRAQMNVNDLWDKANHAYTNGDYQAAIGGYDSIVNSGYGSAKLYYNLGNAYFKDKQIGKAILNYNKAQRLAPSDNDIRHNLVIAGGFVKDRIEVVPEFFLKTWLRSLMTSASSNSWAVFSLVFLAAALAMVALYLLSSRILYRKTGFYGGIVLVCCFVAAVVFSSIERRAITDPDEAVIMLTAAPVKSSPDANSKDIFVLHEGTVVRVLTSLGAWREVMIADGNKGWVDVKSIEMID